MASKETTRLSEIIRDNQETILHGWVSEQLASGNRTGSLKESDLKAQCKEFLRIIVPAIKANTEVTGKDWEEIKRFLAGVSESRGVLGFSPSETATFVFSLKKMVFEQLRGALSKDADALARETLLASELFDKLGLVTMEAYQKTREAVIHRQQQDMLELSTPVVSLADGILALPLIGTLDSARTQVVMESLLQHIVSTGSTVAIIDITGVPTVDTLVAQHLLKTVTAARLMGADCIISGIRPQIAQTIVHLGVELGNVVTKATLASAFKLALDRNHMAIVRVKPTAAAAKAQE